MLSEVDSKDWEFDCLIVHWGFQQFPCCALGGAICTYRLQHSIEVLSSWLLDQEWKPRPNPSGVTALHLWRWDWRSDCWFYIMHSSMPSRFAFTTLFDNFCLCTSTVSHSHTSSNTLNEGKRREKSLVWLCFFIQFNLHIRKKSAKSSTAPVPFLPQSGFASKSDTVDWLCCCQTPAGDFIVACVNCTMFQMECKMYCRLCISTDDCNYRMLLPKTDYFFALVGVVCCGVRA